MNFMLICIKTDMHGIGRGDLWRNGRSPYS